MNFSVVVRFFRDAVGMFWDGLVSGMQRAVAGTYVVDGCQGTVGSAHFAAGVAEALEGLLRSSQYAWCAVAKPGRIWC
jgi:hypothetical protein